MKCNTTRIKKKAVLMVTLLCLCLTAAAQGTGNETTLNTAGGVVKALYKLVTFKAGTTPDWEKVKSLFIKEAVIVLRTSRQDNTVFSVDGFVADFVSFIDRAKVKQTGFTEKIVRMKTMVFKDIAHILVLYEAVVPGTAMPPQKGVDSIQLIKKKGRWWIAAITNEIPTPEHPVPEALR